MIEIRLLTAKDAADFCQLRLRAVREEPPAFLETPEEVKEKAAEDYFKSGWIAGAFKDGTLIGITGLFRHKGAKVRHKGTVWGVYVVPEARGQSIARHMIETVLQEAEKAGIEQVLITTDVTNKITVHLYQSLGFEPWGVEKHITKLPDRYVDDMVMTKFFK